MHRRLALLTTPLAVAVALGIAAPPASAEPDTGGSYARHMPRPDLTGENFYFVMGDRFENGDPANDTGGLAGDPNTTGFDPTSKGFYNGGDLDGLRSRLDYIQGLGTTAIWLTPIFENKPVQLEDGPSAGYHGYWITDFTQVDPHLGTNQDLTDLVDAAHERGIKVFFDIITNHTADVIGYTDGDRTAYVSKDAVPYRDASGDVFDDRDHAGTEEFPELDPERSFPYVPELDAGEEDLKVPAWLNDVTNYHNRGNTTFTGEDSQYGDFFGLDDLFTEKPEVVDGMVDIYKTWVEDFDIDGFRIDTMKHVNDEFWQEFGPRLQKIAAADGNPDFFMFGEVALDGYDLAAKQFTSHYTTRDRMQAILDFPFQAAARDFASKGVRTKRLVKFFLDDDVYTDSDSNAYSLPTFLGNHDMGRIGYFLKTDNPGADDAELLARDRLAHELMYLSRGNPVVYYGDEQGFAGLGGDQSARQTMFASQVEEYQQGDQLGTDNTGADDNFVTDHPLYEDIAALAALRSEHPALADGAQQVRFHEKRPGLFAFSRIDHAQQREYVVVLNNSTQARSATIPTWVPKGAFRKVYGEGPATLTTNAERRLDVLVPGLSSVVYESRTKIPRSKRAPQTRLGVTTGNVSDGRIAVRANVRGSSFYEVTFQRRLEPLGRWQTIGVDDTAPYRVFDDTATDLLPRDRVSYRAAVLDNAGHTRGTSPITVRVPETVLRVTSPAPNGGVGDVYPVTVTATVDPERPLQVVRFQRSVEGGPWTSLGRDSSAPVYTVVDDVSDLARGTSVRYRATLTEPSGSTVTRTIQVFVSAPEPSVDSVTVAGSLQSELGCPEDWQPGCDTTHLAFDAGDGLWHGTFTLPAGSYDWKVAIDDSWTVNYGSGGAAGGGNLTLVVPEGGGSYVFTWDPITHEPSVVPAD
ncbi:alpha-amylase family glycosyl hydrolase [Nocardioides sp. SR21]|uniref:alpha-amylase family glycosyl hydrolase n=1 Tax=Nocardioides sp. SR21 TaxID=2919501 RepID=UPI001FAA35E3|nr:alpha-amylase family glycosyl hydrolase [Nocardioides sp. SR21]